MSSAGGVACIRRTDPGSCSDASTAPFESSVDSTDHDGGVVVLLISGDHGALGRGNPSSSSLVSSQSASENDYTGEEGDAPDARDGTTIGKIGRFGPSYRMVLPSLRGA